MGWRDINVERIFLILFVLVISMAIGWYSEKAVEKFIIVDKEVLSI